MYDFFLFFKALMHIVKIRLSIFFLSFDQILNTLRNQKKVLNTEINIKKISDFIKRINRIIPGNSCLINSVITYTFLKSYKDELEFIIGVKKDSSGNFLSHSWIEYKNTPLGESEDTDFKEILRIK